MPTESGVKDLIGLLLKMGTTYQENPQKPKPILPTDKLKAQFSESTWLLLVAVVNLNAES